MSDEEAILQDFKGETCDWYDLPCHLSSFGEWLLDALLFVPYWIFEKFLEALAGFIETIPVPEFVQTAATSFGSISPEIMFFAQCVQLEFGVKAVLSAVILRWILTRIPFYK